MANLSYYLFVAATLALVAGAACYWAAVAVRARLAGRRLVTPEGVVLVSGGPLAAERLGSLGSILAANAWIFLLSALVARTIATGHGPYSNQYEFSVAFTFGITTAYLFTEMRWRTRGLGPLTLTLAALLALYGNTLPNQTQPLIPALQNTPLLAIHVGCAMLAYGVFAVAFGAALMYLIQRPDDSVGWLPKRETLDEIGYRSVMLGFPLMALVLILGGWWANIAWGQYWSWDPKETAALVTWLIYGGYLHARALRGWRGTRSALLLILGFGAVLFTYFGNYFLGGLHTYSGL